MLVFFEIDKINVERYYFNRLGENFETDDIVVVLEDPKELSKFRIDYPHIKSYRFIDWLNGASKMYIKSDVFINGNRIPDLLMTKLSQENNCRVFYIQHGLYVDFMKREFSWFVNKFQKSLRYAFYAFRTGSVISLFKIHVLGYSRVLTSTRKELYPHFAFVYSEYWKEWHEKTYFFNNNIKYVFLTNNDSVQHEIELENAAIYCYQTLVEDGRIDVNYFQNIFNEIVKVIRENGMELVVKGHPRMSYSTIEFLKSKGVRVISQGFPRGVMVIGHYSSLLARWVYNEDTLILIKLDGHEIPKTIVNLATSVCAISEFSNILSKKKVKSQNELKLLSEYYFNFSGSNSVYTIDEILVVSDKQDLGFPKN